MPEGDTTVTVNVEEIDMPEASLIDPGILQVALSDMANGAAAASTRRINSADQLSGDSQRMWSIAMTSPTVMAAHGMRVASESGAGRTRAETNRPTETSAAAPSG